MLGAFLLDAWHRDLPGPKMMGAGESDANMICCFREVTAIQALVQLRYQLNSGTGTIQPQGIPAYDATISYFC